MLPFNCPKISNAAADVGADVLSHVVGDFQTAALDRFIRGGNGVVDEGAHLAGFLLFDVVERIEILYFTGKPGGKPVSIELLDIVRATLALQKRGPGGLECVTYRRNQTETGDDDATIQIQDSFCDRVNQWVPSRG